MLKANPMAIKIMMTQEVIDRVALSLLSGQTLKDLVAPAAESHADEHYLVVTLHKGMSARVPTRTFSSIAKLLSCSTKTVHHLMVEHAVESLSPNGCGYCRHATRRLKAKTRAEAVRGRREDPTKYPGCLTIY
ncbi:MAG: hypothetical protein JRN06_09305 [Nitrososphaerota archaeon]|nr:hypothetical protein [Nitrososphaerota archaeon]